MTWMSVVPINWKTIQKQKINPHEKTLSDLKFSFLLQKFIIDFLFKFIIIKKKCELCISFIFIFFCFG